VLTHQSTRSYGYQDDRGRDEYDKGYGGDNEERYQDNYRESDGPRKHKGPSQPFRDVIFLGLDAELTEADVRNPDPASSGS